MTGAETSPMPPAPAAVDDGPARVPGAVVIGGDYQGLGIVRSLGRRNVPVCIVDDERSIGRFSRYATHTESVPSLRDERQTVRHLMRIGRNLGLKGWVLYPTRDETVAALARHKAVLGEFFRVPTPDWNKTKWAWDKRNTYRLAVDLGIPIPKTWYPRDSRDLDSIPATQPLAVKPAIKRNFVYATKAKAWRANGRDELRTLYGQASAHVMPGEVMVQDIIPGGGSQQFAYCAFFKEGRAVGSMVVRRARQHPAEFGRASTFVETVDNPLLEELSGRFLRAIDYYGLVEIEFKLDPRDGQFRLLDVNGRTWGYHSLGARAGVDFAHMLFADQTGRTVAPSRARAGVRWIRLVTDAPTAVVEMIRGRQSVPEYLLSLARCDVEAVFTRDDPMPGILELAHIPYLVAKRGM
jgi:predicted ATP-grasp superfamily ATP-dependent carboligase